VNSATDAFGFPFRDPAWVGKIVIQGLILIIPIVGAIALLGWMMITFDNLRAGRLELAPAGFHLSRGIAMFGVEVIYYVVAYIPSAIVAGIAATLSQNNGLSGAPFLALAQLLQIAGQLLIAFILPAMLVMTYHYGFAGGMNVERVWRLATTNVTNTAAANGPSAKPILPPMEKYAMDLPLLVGLRLSIIDAACG